MSISEDLFAAPAALSYLLARWCCLCTVVGEEYAGAIVKKGYYEDINKERPSGATQINLDQAQARLTAAEQKLIELDSLPANQKAITKIQDHLLSILMHESPQKWTQLEIDNEGANAATARIAEGITTMNTGDRLQHIQENQTMVAIEILVLQKQRHHKSMEPHLR